MRALSAVLALLVLLLRPASGAAAESAPALVVAVAASLVDVVNDIGVRFQQAAGITIRATPGGSNMLARQIVDGAPVDVFVSADEAQMDVVERSGRLAPGTRTRLLGNTLVVIVPADSRLAVGSAADLTRPEVRRIAIGHPEAVPAGVYARRWLEGRGVWSAIAPRAVPLSTVRAALAAVAEGRADAGIVYATDARSTRAVRVAFSVPDDESPAVVYPAAAIQGPNVRDAVRFLAFLRGPEARAIFTAAGFEVLEPEGVRR